MTRDATLSAAASRQPDAPSDHRHERHLLRLVAWPVHWRAASHRSAAPIAGPTHGFEFILNAIRDEVESQALDESKAQGELLLLGLPQQMGEIDDAEYTAKEDALLER